MNQRLGEVRYNKYGLEMEIVGYRNEKDIDVLFESGVIKKHVTYCNFKNGRLTDISRERVRLWKVNYNNEGKLMEIVGYRNDSDLDVKFESGIIRYSVSYSSFKTGKLTERGIVSKYKIGYKPRHKGTRVGEVGVSTYGEKMTIIGYRGYSDMDVKFEDGTIRTGVTYDNFQAGTIGKIYQISSLTKSFRVGETNRNTQGYLMTIIRYRSVKSIDVAFEDGTIRNNVMYKNFKKGLVAKRKRC